MNWRIPVALSLMLLAGLLLFLLAPILTPFVVSFVLAYVSNPVVLQFQKWRFPRSLAVALVFGLFVLFLVIALFGLVPALQRQIFSLASRIPVYIDWLITVAIPWMQHSWGLDFSTLDLGSMKTALTQHWRDVGKWLGGAAFRVSETGLDVISWVINLALIPVISFYLMRDWDGLLKRIDALISPGARPRVRQLTKETDEVLSSFMRGQLTVMVVLALVYCIGLSVMGLDLALPIGLLAGAVSFVPYMGVLVGALAAGAAALFQFHDATMLLWVAAVFMIGQILEGFVLTPLLIGDRLGLHPVAVIFAVMAGGQLFGFIGVLLALPVAAVLVVLLRHLHNAYSETPLPRRKQKRRKKTLKAGHVKSQAT
ncbi:MAG: AI-2E family transporter [Gammaproteobacteria bacterium]|nr:AI-2E family transporter [Gammaproteobacteria bacterium]